MINDKVLTGYKITDDPNFLDKYNAITPELSKQLEHYHKLALEGKKSSIQKFLSAIEKYPDNPQLKNYLSVLYSQLGETQKSYETNRWIIAEHPDYLFGKLNLANEYFLKKEYHKMPEVLGEEMELKALYPHRDTFHINEVTSFLKCAILYFSSVGKLEDAEIRYEILDDLAPDSPDAEQAFRHLMIARMDAGMKRMEEENKMRITVKVKKQPETTRETPPEFTHPEIELLYQKGLYIEKEVLDKILALPGKTLIEDLEKILNDSVHRFTYFSNKFKNEGWNEETSTFVVHAFFLLGELQAEKSLDCIFNILSQSEEYLNAYLGDFLTDSLWEPVYKIANNQLDKCLQFMFRPGIHTHSKTLFTDIAEQVVHYRPQRKDEIVAWYREVINFFLTCKRKDNSIDSDVIGLMICNILDINARELLPEIKQLFYKKLSQQEFAEPILTLKRLSLKNTEGTIIKKKY